MNPKAAQMAHSWLVEQEDLYTNVIDHAGAYDAKVDSSANSSLAAHILNAVTVGVNTFVYNAVRSDEDVTEYEEEIRVLAAALALHDTNKYVREAYGFDADGNTADAFDYYFDPEDGEGDDFGIEEFLGDGYRDDLHYLVQRTEVREDTRETRATDTEFRGLERYCRIGDQIASVALRGGITEVAEKLATYFGDEVHYIEFTELEQPVLNDLLISTVKEVIAGEGNFETKGVIIGSTPDGVLYLGNSIEREKLQKLTLNRLPERIQDEFTFSCKLGWNKFDYDILAEIEIPIGRKKDRIREQATELIKSDAGGTEPFELIPNEFTEYLPVLIKAIYEDNRKEYPTEDLTEAYESVYHSIEGGKSTKGQKVKIKLLKYLCKNFDEYRDDLRSLQAEIGEELDGDLTPETDATGDIIERFFSITTKLSLAPKDRMCFLCGAEADTKYQKGYGIYQTQGYSRRVSPHSKYKTICGVCNLEYALFSHVCGEHDINTSESLETAYFYFSDFLGDVRVRRRRIGNVVHGDANELDDTKVTTGLVSSQYFIQPIFIRGENHRMAVIRQVMQAAQDAGMKVVVGRPFTRFESADAVFTDEEATRPQELLGLDEAERFGPLPDFVSEDRTDSHLRRSLQLFKIMSMVGQEANMSNPYIQLDRDTFHSIADFAVVNHEHATRLSDLREYFETYHQDALMEMRTIAERGIDLFGKQFDSKYKKTKVFREAIDAFLSGKNQRMEDDELIEYVESQVYAVAEREDYAGYVETGEAEAFVEAIHTYLVENDLDDLKKLSDWEDALVNSYYYAYDQALQDQ
ncbi:hypothetical protein [Halostella salina]|uniref:hypothetical protein n=1 Tax=Halostella salina TaxID=1547897 RepID=UPI000EF80CC2|nr:hypothetical protein [Halostella salina]